MRCVAPCWVHYQAGGPRLRVGGAEDLVGHYPEVAQAEDIADCPSGSVPPYLPALRRQ